MLNSSKNNWEKIVIPQYSEITWKDSVINDSDIKKIKEKTRTCVVKFWNMWVSVRVYFSNSDYEELLQEKFEISEDNWEDLSELVFCDWIENEWCFITNWLYIKWSWFWILKSVISWYATFLRSDLLPMHTSVIDTSIWWLSFVWWHGAWKSTTLFRVMEILDTLSLNPTPLTDDWGWSKIDNTWTFDFSVVDRTISLNKKIIWENSWLKVFQDFDMNSLKWRKFSLPAEKLYWTRKVFNSRLKSIILLDQSWIELEQINVWRFITDSAYHYPYIWNSLISEHSKQWNDWLSWINLSLYNRIWNLQDFMKRLVDWLTK